MINHFKALPPNTVYTIAPKDYVMRGYAYFYEERLESFRWEHDRSRLTAVVRGTKRHAVDFSVVDDKIESACNCPTWHQETQCKHVVCALLTIINLLSPLHFRVTIHHPRRLEKLRAALLYDGGGDFKKFRGLGSSEPPAHSKPDNFELVIQLRGQHPELSVRNHGQRLYTLWGVPETLVYFIGDFYHSFPVHRDRFAQHLQAEGNRYPIIFECDGEYKRVKWEPFHRCEMYTELDVVEGQAMFRPLYFIDRVVRKRVKLFWDYAVDLEQHVLVRMEELNEWDVQTKLYDEWRYGLETLDNEHTFSSSWAYQFWERFITWNESSWEQLKVGTFERQPIALPLRRAQSIPVYIPTPHLEATCQRLVVKVNGIVTPLSGKRRKVGASRATTSSGCVSRSGRF